MTGSQKDELVKCLQKENAQLNTRVRELERLLGMNSRNSSKPPSSDPPSAPKKSAPKRRKKRDAKKGYEPHLKEMLPPDKVNRDERNRPFANGQCMLFRREWYDRIGGHAAVQDDLLEDLAFSRRIDVEGGRVRVLAADGLLLEEDVARYAAAATTRNPLDPDVKLAPLVLPH